MEDTATTRRDSFSDYDREGEGEFGYMSEGDDCECEIISEECVEAEGEAHPCFGAAGYDSEGEKYESAEQFWAAMSPNWYKQSAEFWDGKSDDQQAVTGVPPKYLPLDIAFSRKFLSELYPDESSRGRAIDCGAGYGRTVEQLLIPAGFSQVDLLEPCSKLLAQAQERLAALPSSSKSHVGQFLCEGLQSFPFSDTYSCMFIQWVLLYLTDDDAVSMLKRCKQALQGNPHSFIVVKENISRRGFYCDREDSSITRPMEHMLSLFERSGLRVVKQEQQPDFPACFFPVWMYALQ